MEPFSCWGLYILLSLSCHVTSGIVKTLLSCTALWNSLDNRLWWLILTILYSGCRDGRISASQVRSSQQYVPGLPKMEASELLPPSPPPAKGHRIGDPSYNFSRILISPTLWFKASLPGQELGWFWRLDDKNCWGLGIFLSAAEILGASISWINNRLQLAQSCP